MVTTAKLNYKIQYTDPIVVEAGTAVRVERSDPDESARELPLTRNALS